MSVAVPIFGDCDGESLVELLAENEWPIEVLFLAWGWLAEDRSRSEAVRACGRAPFEALLDLLEANGFAESKVLRAAIKLNDCSTARALAQAGFDHTPRYKVNIVLRRHNAARDLAKRCSADSANPLH
jgi:hypothetical protein